MTTSTGPRSSTSSASTRSGRSRWTRSRRPTRPPGHADGPRPAGLRALHPGHAPQPGRPRLARPRPLHPVRGPRVDAALLDALPHRVRPHARRPEELPPGGQPHRRAIPSAGTPRDRGHHRARSARASRWPWAWRSRSACWRRASTAPATTDRDHPPSSSPATATSRRAWPRRGLLARRPPGPRAPDRLLRQQPHPARRPDAMAFSEDVGALRGLRLARAGPGRGPPLERIERRSARPQAVTDRPSLIILRTHIGYGTPNKQDTYKAHGSPLGEDEVRADQGGLRLGPRRAVPGARRGARALPRAPASAGAQTRPPGTSAWRPTARDPDAKDELRGRSRGACPRAGTPTCRASTRRRRRSPPARPRAR